MTKEMQTSPAKLVANWRTRSDIRAVTVRIKGSKDNPRQKVSKPVSKYLWLLSKHTYDVSSNAELISA